MTHKTFLRGVNPQGGNSSVFWVLFLAGFISILVGVLFLVAAAVLSDASTSFGIVIFLGPFPIAIGGGSQYPWLILLAIVLTVLSVVMFLVTRRKTESAIM